MGKAVFLSYASQDAETARRLAEALRAAGVEVWFDQSELKGGDTWDQKIRRQIKECTLFLPIISASTQSRPEGYFRLEWKLAVDRSHMLADDHPFLFPVVIDDTAEAAARVPDRFRDFQWSRLTLNETPSELAGRVAGLFSGQDAAATVTSREETSRVEKRRGRRERKPGWLNYTLRLGGLAIGLGYLTKSLWSPQAAPSPAAANVVAPAPASKADGLAARAKAIYTTTGYTREELQAAEDFAQQAVQSDRNSAAAWGTLAGVHATFVQRNWDVSQKRRQDAQAASNRALALDPKSAEALFARGQLLIRGGANLSAEAEVFFRRALELEPANNRFRRAVADTLGRQNRREEQKQLLEEAVKRDPADPLVRYDFAQWFLGADGVYFAISPENITEALRQIDAGLKTNKLNSLLVLRARLQGANGDLRGMRESLDDLEKLPLSQREEDRAVNMAIWGALLEKDLKRAIAAATLTSKAYFDDGALAIRSKEALIALARQQAGTQGLAQLAWKQAEATLRARLRDEPTNFTYQADLAKILAWEGQSEEAARIFAPLETAIREGTGRNLHVAQYYAALGDASHAVPYLRSYLFRTLYVTPATLRLDPWWDKLRGQPEFDTFVAEAEAAEKAETGASNGQKSTP